MRHDQGEWVADIAFEILAKKEFFQSFILFGELIKLSQYSILMEFASKCGIFKLPEVGAKSQN